MLFATIGFHPYNTILSEEIRYPETYTQYDSILTCMILWNSEAKQIYCEIKKREIYTK